MVQLKVTSDVENSIDSAEDGAGGGVDLTVRRDGTLGRQGMSGNFRRAKRIPPGPAVSVSPDRNSRVLLTPSDLSRQPTVIPNETRGGAGETINQEKRKREINDCFFFLPFVVRSLEAPPPC